jgi:dTMP kinase
VGRLVVIEGIDGSGKRTVADGLEKALRECGRSVRRMGFPRYGRSHAADLVRDALYGRAGDLSGSVYGMAVLYAMDRAHARDELADAVHGSDVLLLDRYVASNAAYGAARLGPDDAEEFLDWVRELEFGRLGLPVPDLQVLLRVPVPVAVARTGRRADEEPGRERDGFETDGGLQERVAAVYEELAATRWLSPWHVVDSAADVDHAALAGAVGNAG